jgi:TP901 family phage tail tape measure protein
VSFANLSDIAALGGQLGVGAQDITAFTKVVSELSATTNLTAEAAGTALGRFRALFSQQDTNFSALGSAILKVGVNSVATESQIVNTSTQIASMGRFAGFTAEQVVGLSGALASVGTQPELSRGTITRVFTNMAVAVQGGGAKLDEFARISNVSAEEFKRTWGTPQFAGTFQKFLAGLGTEGQSAIGTLKELGHHVYALTFLLC